MPQLQNWANLGDEEKPWPIQPTVLEQQVRAGLKRASEPGKGLPYKGGLLGGPLKALAGTQDIAGGLLQALMAPVTSAVSTAAPLLQAAGNVPVPGLSIGDESVKFGDVGKAASTLPGEISKVLLNRGLGYDKERSQEVGDTIGVPYGKLAALAKVGAPLGATFIALHQIPKEIWNERTDIQSRYADYLDMTQHDDPAGAVFRQTGMFKHPFDGDTRIEIPDNEMRLKMPLTQIQRLAQEIHQGRETEPLWSDIVQHDKLLEILPQVADFRMGFRSGRGAAFTAESPTLISPQDHLMHGWNPKPGQMTMGIGSISDPNRLIAGGEFMNDIVHETGHGIDSWNPVASGGANEAIAGGFDPYYRDSGENTVRLAANRRNLTPAQLRQYYPFADDRVHLNWLHYSNNPQFAAYNPLNPYYAEIPRSKTLTHFKANLDDTIKWNEFYDEYNRLKGRSK